MNPKVLVISNECFSKTNSNGRTLGNFFIGWPKEKIAQFFLAGNPDADYCLHYFRVSDLQALNALLFRTNIGGVITLDDAVPVFSHSSDTGKRHARNAFTMLCRNAIWSSGAWMKCGFWDWAEDFKPEIILLQAGDCAFLFNLAVKVAKRTRAKLIIYNSEGYYYKNYDYFCGKGISHALYPIFRKQLRRALIRAYAIADCVIYNCDELKEQFAKDFSHRAETIYIGSEIKYMEKAKSNDVFTTVYCGNLGLKRHESLFEIADVLQNISPNLYVDVYGKAPNSEVEKALNSHSGIHYHGVVPYERVKDLLRDSDLLLYVESFDSFYQEDIKFGFSTKIADSLSSGNCFLLYAPEHFACYQYLKNNHAAYTVSDKDTLRDLLSQLVISPAARERYRETALELAERNHKVKKNNRKFQMLLLELVN